MCSSDLIPNKSLENLNQFLNNDTVTIVLKKIPESYNIDESLLYSPTLNNYTIIINSEGVIIACGDHNLFSTVYGFDISKLIGQKISDLPLHTPMVNIIVTMIKKVKETNKFKACLALIGSKNYICVCFPLHGETNTISFVFTKQTYLNIDMSIFDD